MQFGLTHTQNTCHALDLNVTVSPFFARTRFMYDTKRPLLCRG